MAAQPLSLLILSLLPLGIWADPAPGRIPKVYNALITSNQNLEPSKAYPVYQPVLHEAYTFPFQPAVFYGGEFPNYNGLFPAPALLPKEPQPPQSQPPQPQPSQPQPPQPQPPQPPLASTPESSPEPAPSSTQAPPQPPTLDSSTQASNAGPSIPAPPPPPNTQSPIPLNEFGLPPHVLPLGRIDPTYDGYTQVGPFAYTYPGLRFYDPFDPFSLSPFANFPLYRPLTNVLGQSVPQVASQEVAPAAPQAQPVENTASAQTPPPEPSDLNVLNYSSKDPAIPDVPPPPLPQGGLKSDKTE